MEPRRSVPEVLLGILAVLSALATLAFVGHAFVASPQNPVAAEIGFEALRVARGLALYVDPWTGAWEDGAPPSRYYVLYTPVFPWILGKLSALLAPAGGPSLASVRVVGRVVAVTGWLVVHLAPVLGAPRRERAVTAIAAMLAGGVYFVSRHAASMSPDTLATALVCVGVVRAAARERIDPASAVLLIAAPLVKPSCLGGVAGAALVHLALRRPGWVRSTTAAAATAGLLALACHLASDGAWLSNISRSTGQPLTLTRWVEELGSRVIVLGLPHVVVAWLAWRRRVTWLVLGPLLGSIAWTTFMMAKHGSGSHYWLEPTGLALIAISRMPSRPVSSAAGAAREPAWVARVLPWAAVAFGVVVAAVSWPRYLAEPARYRQHREVAAAVDRHCARGAGEFVVSSDLALELSLNGRISVPAWQSAFLARSGRFPVDEWRADLARPEVRWVALALDPRAPVGTSNDEQVERSPFQDVLADVLFEHYVFDATVGGMFVFRRRP
ncbi:MAG: hypothetical protein KF850_18390 [Labilithrix sp.]|nr:hypothetical protein [Labilithrix sp.]